MNSRVHAEWHAQVGESELVLSPLGFHVAPALFDAATARVLDELLTDTAVGEPLDVLNDQTRDEPSTAPVIIEPYRDPPFEVEIRVLGSVDIVGNVAAVDRRRCIELATYLALHPNGVSDDRLKTVLWPDSTPTTATFNTTVSATRSRLGRGSNGDLHFPHFVASGNVISTRLPRHHGSRGASSHRVAYPRQCAPAMAIETLRSALDLVRGRPFEGVRGSSGPSARD